jgi:hypothetical protein
MFAGTGLVATCRNPAGEAVRLQRWDVAIIESIVTKTVQSFGDFWAANDEFASDTRKSTIVVML